MMANASARQDLNQKEQYVSISTNAKRKKFADLFLFALTTLVVLIVNVVMGMWELHQKYHAKPLVMMLTAETTRTVNLMAMMHIAFVMKAGLSIPAT